MACAAFDLVTPVRRYDGLRVGLPGAHQRQNAALAVRTLEVAWPRAFGQALPAAAVRTGLAEVTRRAGLRGRLDVIARAPLTVADVAHNPDALAATLAALRPARAAPHGRLHVVLGLLRDKDAAAMARLLAEAGAAVTPAPLDGPRALPTDALVAVLRRHGLAVRAPAPAAAAVACLRAEARAGDVLLVTGSHRVVAQLPETPDTRAPDASAPNASAPDASARTLRRLNVGTFERPGAMRRRKARRAVRRASGRAASSRGWSPPAVA